MKFANKISFNKATLFLSLMIFWGDDRDVHPHRRLVISKVKM
jgi:hypothetical protein